MRRFSIAFIEAENLTALGTQLTQRIDRVPGILKTTTNVLVK